MRPLDLTVNPKIDFYTRLLRRVSLHTDPAEVQREFATMVREDNRVDGMISLSVRGLPSGSYKITRMNIDDDLGVVSMNPWAEWAKIPAMTGGVLGMLIEKPEPRIFHHMKIENDPVLGDRLARFGSCFANPLFDEGQALNWSISFKRDPEGFSALDAESFVLRGNIIGRMTKSLVIAKQVKDLNTRLAAQLEEIAQIQRSLLPSQLPDAPGLNIATSYLTSNEAGGDYYDFFDMGKGKLGVVVADVSGHGAGAATMMAMLQAILHGYQDRERGPAAMLEHANREILRKRIEGSFITAYMGVFDTERRRLTYSNAGHNHPQVRSHSGEMRAIDGASSLPLGILEKPEYTEDAVPLVARDTVVIYTDGITEAFSPPPTRQMFGTERFREALRMSDGEPASVIDSVFMRLIEHTRSRDRADDQTLVAVRVEE